MICVAGVACGAVLSSTDTPHPGSGPDLRSGKLSWDQDQIAAQAAETFFEAAGP